MVPRPPSTVQTARNDFAARLRELRTEAGLTGRDLAVAAGWQPSKVSRIEHGRQPPSAADVEVWCRLCGVAGQLADLLASLHNVEGLYVEWRRLERSGMRRMQDLAEPLYDRTRLFRIYEPGIIPGLFQTPAYIHASLTRLAAFDSAPGGVDDAVRVRVDRQRLINSRDRRFIAIIEESALLARVSDADTMAGQLGHLINVASLPSVGLGIIPSDIERARWASPGFWIFDDACVQLELPSALMTITQPQEVEIYTRAFGEFAAMAVLGARARTPIMRAIDRLTA